MDVDERGDCLNLGALLCMIDEVSLAGLVFGVPFEDVELCAHRKQMSRDQDIRWIVPEDYWLGAVDPYPEKHQRWRVGRFAVLRRQRLVESP